MRQLRNLNIFAWRLWIAWKMGEETQGLDPGFLKLRKLQAQDPRLFPTPDILICINHGKRDLTCTQFMQPMHKIAHGPASEALFVFFH